MATTISPDTTVATQFGVAFGPPVYFDTQRFLVHRNAVKTLADLKNRLVCVIKLSDPERTLHDELSAQMLIYKSDDFAEFKKARAEGRTPVYRTT